MVRSQDGNAIDQSGNVRICHGFGKPDIHIGGKLINVQSEDVISLT